MSNEKVTASNSLVEVETVELQHLSGQAGIFGHVGQLSLLSCVFLPSRPRSELASNRPKRTWILKATQHSLMTKTPQSQTVSFLLQEASAQWLLPVVGTHVAQVGVYCSSASPSLSSAAACWPPVWLCASPTLFTTIFATARPQTKLFQTTDVQSARPCQIWRTTPPWPLTQTAVIWSTRQERPSHWCTHLSERSASVTHRCT